MAHQTFQVLLTLLLLSHHVLCSTPTNVSNTTEQHQTHQFVGWQDSPSQRGTITLLWTCLSTIIVSTWTLLHLNVPGLKDSAWQKTKRKIRWMVLTVLFPELTFSKAVCELQMAVEDLHSMKLMEEHIRATTQWRVEFGRGSEFLYNMFQYIGFKRPESPTSERERNEEPEERSTSEGKVTAWTLTHSYFANMGGLARRTPEMYCGVTAYALAKCCGRTPHSPLLTTVFDEDDIKDRSKADWLSKSIAIVQVCWLLMSIIVRKIRSLPISQLEVCTTAFAVLGTATWLANWSKPKDVDRPITFQIEGFDLDCDVPDLYEQSPYRQLSQPHKSSRNKYSRLIFNRRTYNWRVYNDLVRFDSRYPIAASIMAVSTTIFGGIHCLAWNALFPSSIESTIWKTASLLTTVMPLVALAATGIITRLFNNRIDTAFLAWKSKLINNTICLAAEFDQKGACVAGDLKIFEQEIKRVVFQYHVTHGMVFLSLEDFLRSIRHLFESKSPHYHLEYFFVKWYITATTIKNVPLQVPEMTELSSENRVRFQNDIRAMINLIEAPEERERMRGAVMELQWLKDSICGCIMIITGIIYLIARLMILALALAALRKQDERLYVETWTRYLPNIS